MPSKTKRKTKTPLSPRAIADPAAMLAAAEEAPKVFHMAAYFRPIYIMRQKGYSWRELGKWVRQFNIEISPVHLRRLYVQESARLTRLTADQLADQGCPEDMIDELLTKDDPTSRLTAVDPEDAALVQARRKFLKEEAGLSDDEIGDADLTSPVKVGDKTL